MENQQTPAWKHSFNYGMIIGIILIAISLIFYVLDYNSFEHRWIGWVSTVFMFAGMTIATLNYRNHQQGGFITYGASFKIHFLTGLFAGIISGIFTVIFMTYLGDELKQLALENAENEVLKRNPNASDQELEMAVQFTEWFMNPVMMGVMGIASSAALGAIYGLIASIFIKKEDPNQPPVI